LSPLRTARKSAGGFGNSSDGGFGGAIVAQAVNNTGKPINAIVTPRRMWGRALSPVRGSNARQRTWPPAPINSKQTLTRENCIDLSTMRIVSGKKGGYSHQRKPKPELRGPLAALTNV
jgi:hypothetical protein